MLHAGRILSRRGKARAFPPLTKLVPALLVVAALAAGPACESVAPYAAIVDGERISKTALDNELKAILGNPEYLASLEQAQAGRGLAVRGRGNGTVDAAFVAQVLTRRIYLELIHQEVVRRKLRLSDAELDRARQDLTESLGGDKVLKKFDSGYIDEIVRSSAEVNVLQQALAGKGVSDADVEKFYADNQEQYARTCVSHILVETKAQADSVRTRLAAGGDFAQIAAAESKDTGSAAQGGSLDCLTATETASFVAPFRDAIPKLAVNEVSVPVETQFGFHVIKVTAREVQSLEDVRDDIRRQLSGSEAGAAFDTFLIGAIEDAKVDVNPRYGEFVKNPGEQPRVVPPRMPSTTVAEGPDGPDGPGAPGAPGAPGGPGGAEPEAEPHTDGE